MVKEIHDNDVTETSSRSRFFFFGKLIPLKICVSVASVQNEVTLTHKVRAERNRNYLKGAGLFKRHICVLT